jgi:hypothetical protein
MSNAIETVKQALADIEAGNVQASTYTEDLSFSGPVPQPLGLEPYLSLMRALVAASPDWNFHAHGYWQDGDTVTVQIAITGTQTRTLRSLMPGMPELPPTGKRFALPAEELTFTLRGDRICAIQAKVPPGGGVPGMLKQLGVQTPA